MNPKLLDAVAIFKDLGWEGLTAENVLQLPIGTPEQKRTALAGLKSGEWGKFERIKKDGGSTLLIWKNYFDVKASHLALFAVRIGVDASRAVNILGGADNEILLPIIAERGAKYATDFIGHACVSRRRSTEHSASAFGNVVVRLVDTLDLALPQSVEYMKDWSVYAAFAMGLKAVKAYHKEAVLPSLDMIQGRFAEHITMGVAVNVPATGPFGLLLPDGVKRGWLERGEALQLAFSALDATVRSGDRKAWLNVLDALGITDDELCERMQALIPVLATGDAAVLDRFAPVFIVRASEELLGEMLVAAFSGSTKKAKQLALKSALDRPCPNNAEELAPWLAALANDKDRAISSLAARLSKQWGMSVEVLPEEANEVQGLWREAPRVWEPPLFELGAVSPEALTELASQLVNQSSVIHDVTAERFLAMANALAYQDPEAARRSLRGLRSGGWFLQFIIYWVSGNERDYGFDSDKYGAFDPLIARDSTVSFHLDKIPCLLSMPSAVDLSISVPDLTERLALYKKSGVDALEADLFLALTRLDPKTATPDTALALQDLDVSVILQSGEKMPIAAGPAALAYLDDPVKEPPLRVSHYGYWGSSEIAIPDSLRGFPARFKKGRREPNSVFPYWGDAALTDVKWDSEVYHEKGLVLRQIARRASPLPPGAAINFLAAQRSHTLDAAEDAMLAVTEAWERGLLRPGVADVALLDWSAKPPTNLAALAAALDAIARDGMLAVVWPVLDALIAASLEAPRLLAGTAELAELVAEFLPEVESACGRGAADRSALDLPGTRALAVQGGASRAVRAAATVSARLPTVEVAPKKTAPAMKVPFDEVWPTGNAIVPLLDDGVTVTVDWANPGSPSKQFLFTLTLPTIADRIFQVVNTGWIYGLEKEGQSDALAVLPGTTAFSNNRENQVWLHWDAEQNALVVCDKRNWREGKDNPLSGARTPLSSSLLTVVIGLLAQDGDAVYYAPRLLNKVIENGQINAEAVRNSVRILLRYPVVSPAKLVRPLEKDSKLLPILWPLLTESTQHAGSLVATGENPPVWVNRILDNALRYAPYLAEAATRGLIGAEDAQWAGVPRIASSTSKSAAVAKAKQLAAALGV